MKCKYCNGTGEHINDANRMTTCEFCGGTGVTEPLTNDEWRRTCSTEEFAEWLTEFAISLIPNELTVLSQKIKTSKNNTLDWLKEKHDG